MLKIIFWFLALAAAAAGLTWLAEHPGVVSIEWLGWRIESMPAALALGIVAAGAFAVWLVLRILRMILATPGAARDYFRLRRRRKGLDELTGGMMALLAGDAAAARKAARNAARLAPGEAAARLLEARAAQELGDDRAAGSILKEMLDDDRTRAAALHGLYEQARRAGDAAAASAWAERAYAAHPALPWAARAVLAAAAAREDWPAVRALLDRQRRDGLISKQEARRKQAVALTAEALRMEEKDPAAAAEMAVRAHKLDPALIPAATTAGGILASTGAMRRAAKILEKTWKLAPHPDIAEIYAHLRAGDSPADRLKRVRRLLRVSAGGEEGAVALARAAIEAREWETARGALRSWLSEDPSSRVCQLMAEIEQEQYGDRGRAREWLARAVRARRNPAWTADGMVSPEWLPASPVSGEIGVFEWKIPLSGHDRAGALEPVPAELLEALPATPAEEPKAPPAPPKAPEDEPAPDARARAAKEETAAQTGEERPPAGKDDKAEADTPAKEPPAAEKTEEAAAPRPARAKAKAREKKGEEEKPAPARRAQRRPAASGESGKAEKGGEDRNRTEEEALTPPIPDDPGPAPEEGDPAGATRAGGWIG